MSYTRFVESLEPVLYAPLDAVDFDGSVEDVVSFDISEPGDAELVSAGGIKNEEDCVKVTTAIDFAIVTGTTPSAVLAVLVPESTTSQDLLITDSTAASAASGATTATVSIGAETSPSFPVNQWHHLVLVGSTWDVLDLETAGEELLLQHVSLYDYALSAQQIADLQTAAAESRIIREVTATNDVQVSDEGATATATEWHIVSR
ncbi:MAG: hypothetical protein LC650_00865 [Actinobacteria bacterium]|nr:hypothetical protein [Actinomycetota bacterium]